MKRIAAFAPDSEMTTLPPPQNQSGRQFPIVRRGGNPLVSR